jgi:hypothetical protein
MSREPRSSLRGDELRKQKSREGTDVPYLVPSDRHLCQLCQFGSIFLLDNAPGVQSVRNVNTQRLIRRHLSFQKFLNSSVVFDAPRIRANIKLGPASAAPQNELQ